jgi:hypothetical protein
VFASASSGLAAAHALELGPGLRVDPLLDRHSRRRGKAHLGELVQEDLGRASVHLALDRASLGREIIYLSGGAVGGYERLLPEEAFD